MAGGGSWRISAAEIGHDPPASDQARRGRGAGPHGTLFGFDFSGNVLEVCPYRPFM